MINVDFYILEAANAQKSLRFACELLEKMYQAAKTIYVYAASADEAIEFDNLLWTYREDSFIPHQLHTAEATCPAPIQIGYPGQQINMKDVLLNLTTEIPPFHTQFAQIIEIVYKDPPVQQFARDRFREYRERGYEMKTHKLK